MSISEKEQQKNESLSAFIDAEQSDIETAQIIDALLKDSHYKEKYIRTQLVNDILHDQVQESLINEPLNNRISIALNDLPAHYVDTAVSLQRPNTEVVTSSNWFQKLLANRALSGLSVAVSVMLVTLFTLQHFDSSSLDSTSNQGSTNQAATSYINTSNSAVNSSRVQVSPELPMTMVSTGGVSTGGVSTGGVSTRGISNKVAVASASSNNPQQNYRWIEADPDLYRQVRHYINEHEIHRAAYSLQPKVRTTVYQINE